MSDRGEGGGERDNGQRVSLVGMGCLVVALVVGFVIGLNAGGKMLPGGLNWVFAGMFALFFGILAAVFTGMGLRRERGVVSDTIMAIPSRVAVSLKEAIERANPPAQLETTRIGRLDATLAELEELGSLLRRQPRAGTNPAVKARLEEIAMEWLDEESLQEWLASVEPGTN